MLIIGIYHNIDIFKILIFEDIFEYIPEMDKYVYPTVACNNSSKCRSTNSGVSLAQTQIAQY